MEVEISLILVCQGPILLLIRAVHNPQLPKRVVTEMEEWHLVLPQVELEAPAMPAEIQILLVIKKETENFQQLKLPKVPPRIQTQMPIER